MKYKVKLFIFGVETFMIFCIVSTMIFTRIYNGSYFSIFHQFDKQEHLILKKKISNRDSIVIFERGEPVFFEKNHLEIRLSNRIDTIPDDKVLLLEIIEKNGARHQTVEIAAKELLEAKLL